MPTPVRVGATYNQYYEAAVGSITIPLGATPETQGTLGTIAATDSLLASININMSGTIDPGPISVAGFETLWQAWSSTLSIRAWIGRRINPTAGETPSYAATWAGACRSVSWTLERFTGVDNSVTPPLANSVVTTGGVSYIAPTVTPTTTADLLQCFYFTYQGRGAITTPPGMTPVINIPSTGSTCPQIYVEELSPVAVTPSGTKTLTVTTSSTYMAASITLTSGAGAPATTRKAATNTTIGC